VQIGSKRADRLLEILARPRTQTRTIYADAGSSQKRKHECP
jgi:hypothetical protein